MLGKVLLQPSLAELNLYDEVFNGGSDLQILRAASF
jgi:hypothetical protein